MDQQQVRTVRYLALDEMAADPCLARRLPAELARRFHALPLAEDSGRITVAMANPADNQAREAIVEALGPESCVVQADPVAIDTLLAEVWGTEEDHRPRLALCSPNNGVSSEVNDYAESLAELMATNLDRIAEESAPGTKDRVDLLILADLDHPQIGPLLSHSPEGNKPGAILALRRPRWPLREILLVLCGTDRDSDAIDWVLRLARPSHSHVVVLAVVPPVPAMYGQRGAMSGDLPSLLSAQSPLGRHMRMAARNLVDWEIDCTLRLRQGPPDLQICREVASGEYDLIVLSDQRPQGWLRWLDRDLIGDLLGRIDRPILISSRASA